MKRSDDYDRHKLGLEDSSDLCIDTFNGDCEMPENMVLKVDLKAAEKQPKYVQSYVSFFAKNSVILFSKLAHEEVTITRCVKSSGQLDIRVDPAYAEGVLNGTVEQNGVTVEITNLQLQRGGASIQLDELEDGDVNYSNLHFSPVIVGHSTVDVKQADEHGKHRFTLLYHGSMVPFGHGQLSATAYYGIADEESEVQINQECDYHIINGNAIVDVVLPNDHDYTRLSNIIIVPDNSSFISGAIVPKIATWNNYQPLITLTSKESDKSRIKMYSFARGEDDSANVMISSKDILPISSNGTTVTFKKIVSDDETQLSVIVKDKDDVIIESYETGLLIEDDTISIQSLSEYLHESYRVSPIDLEDEYLHFNGEDEVVVTLEGSNECDFISSSTDTKLIAMNSSLCVYKYLETDKYTDPDDVNIDDTMITDAGVLSIDAVITPLLNGKVNKDSSITVNDDVRSVQFDTDKLKPEIDCQMRTSVFHNEDTDSNNYYKVGICPLNGSSVDDIVNNIIDMEEAIFLEPSQHYIALGFEGSPSEESVYYLLNNEISEKLPGYTITIPLNYVSTEPVEVTIVPVGDKIPVHEPGIVANVTPMFPDSFTLFILEKGTSLSGIMYLTLCDTDEEADSQTIDDETAVLSLRKIV